MGDISKEAKENRKHQKLLQKNGHWAEIIDYKDSEHVTYLWDNKIVTHASYKRFRDGLISYDKLGDVSNCIGDKLIQKNGLVAEIIRGENTGDIDILFENGIMVEHTTYHQWEIGNVSFPKDEARRQHVGKSSLQRNGYVFVIDSIEGTNKVYGHFLDGEDTQAVTSIKAFNAGSVAHPYGDKETLKQRKERLGSKLIQHNGLTLTIDRYRTSQDCGGYFEDGTRVEHFKYHKASTGYIGHPTLSSFGNGEYKGFTTFPAFADETQVYYKCKCKKCGLEDILTPQQMMKHSSNC